MSSTSILKKSIYILCGLIVIAVGLFALLQFQLSNASAEEPPVNESSSNENSASSVSLSGIDLSDNIEELENIDWGDVGVITKIDGVVNILIIGQDSRGEERERSDSMILVSVNQNSNCITMISLMRDLYVQIPDYGQRKLNAAYALGGAELLNETIEQNFGVAIDYNVEVDFSGFESIVDALGGVDMELTHAEAEYINGKVGTDDLTEGANHLTGEQALWYARTRKVGNSDWERTNRQRKLIKAIYADAKSSDWATLWKLYNSVSDCITTDMNLLQIMGIAFSAWNMDIDELNSYRIPADGMAYDETISGIGSVLVPYSWDETRQLFKDYLYSDDGGVSAFENIAEKYGTQDYD